MPPELGCRRLSLADVKSSYLIIERNGKAGDLAATTDLTTTQAHTDQELKDAIDELNRSTEAINKQTETLRQQQDALSRLLMTAGKSGDARFDLEAKRLYKWETDRKGLNTAVGAIYQPLPSTHSPNTDPITRLSCYHRALTIESPNWSNSVKDPVVMWTN